MTSKLQTITNPDWLENEHAGQMLVSEFLEPEKLSVERLADGIGVAPDRINEVIEGVRSMRISICDLAAISVCPKAFFCAFRTGTKSSKPSAP